MRNQTKSEEIKTKKGGLKKENITRIHNMNP